MYYAAADYKNPSLFHDSESQCVEGHHKGGQVFTPTSWKWLNCCNVSK